MKTLKYFLVIAVVVFGLSSCLVERGGPGYGRGGYHHHHHHGGGGYGYGHHR